MARRTRSLTTRGMMLLLALALLPEIWTTLTAPSRPLAVSAAPATRPTALPPFSAMRSGINTGEARSLNGYALGFVGAIGGSVSTVAVSGTLAYIGEGYTLTVLDIGNPAQPRRLTSIPLLERAIALQVAAGFAYVALPNAGLKIFDLRVPAQPLLRTGYAPPGGIGQLQVDGDLAYITTKGTYTPPQGYRDAGLQILDIRDPLHPALGGSVTTAAPPAALRVAGGYAYISNGGTLEIYDVGDPARPVLRGAYNSPLYWLDNIQIVGDFAYVNATYEAFCHLMIFDVSDRAKPTPVETAWSSGCIDNLQLAGPIAYIAQSGTFALLDTSNPVSPTLLAGLAMPGGVADFQVIGKLAYIAVTDGLQIVDVADAAHPILRAWYDPPYAIQDLQIVGTRAYVAAWGSNSVADRPPQGLQTITVSDPSKPALGGRLATLGPPTGVAISGTLALVGDAGIYSPTLDTRVDNALKLVDVSNPLTPTLLRSYAPAAGASSIQMIGHLAYMITANKNLAIIDIHDPLDPVLLSSTPITLERVGSVQVVGNLAYIVGSGLLIVDVGNPRTPAMRGSYPLPGYDGRGQVAGQYVYAANWDGGLQIIDASDPAYPRLRGNYRADPDWVSDVRVVGDLAYLAVGDGMRIVDVSDPANPVLRGQSDTLVYAQRIKVAGDLVYVADGVSGGGLEILRALELRPRAFVPLIR